MHTFLVAGAGHGGLCAALHLARAGQRVTVIEREREVDLGYDWTDSVEPDALERNGFSPLPQDGWTRAYHMTMIAPGKRHPLRPAEPKRVPTEIHAERKAWLAVMIGDCRAAGVAFEFGTEILGPAMEGDRVCGLRLRVDGQERIRPADMVIDAAGAQSAVREGLPARLGIPGALQKEHLFYAWRGFYERLPGPDPKDMYSMYLSHQGRKGISWVITNPGYIDVLVGNMGGPLSETELAHAITDLRADCPLLGERLLRGGGTQPAIPVRRPLGLFVAGGYAAVGDSACMADPFSGCGICSAMDQGKLLAQLLLKNGGDFSLPALWEYQLRAFARLKAHRRGATEVLRCVMMGMGPKELDLLFERGIIAMRGGVKDARDVRKMLRNVDHPKVLWKLLKIPMRGKAIKEIVHRIPKAYDPAAVAAWVKEYEACKMC